MSAQWPLEPAVWSFGLASAVFAAFALLLLLRLRREARSALFLAAVVLSALWAACVVLFSVTGAPALWRLAVVFDVSRLLGLMAFAFALLRGDAAAAGPRPGWTAPIAMTAVAATVLLIGYPAPGVSEGHGESFLLPLAAMVALSIFGLVLVEQLFRRTPSAQRWHVWPLCVALGGLFSFDLIVFADALLFRSLDGGLWLARGLAQALVVPLLGVAAARNRSWSFDVAMSRGMVLGSTALIGAAAYLLAIALLGYYVQLFGGAWGPTLATAFVFAALLAFAFVAASRTFRSKLRVLVTKNLFAHRYDYREEWLKFSALMATPGAQRPLRERCLIALGELVETSSAALWLRTDRGFEQVARLEQPQVTEIDGARDDLPAFLQATGWVIEVDQARRDPARYRGLQLPAWLRSHRNAWLVVPLLNAEALVGFVLLGRPRVRLQLDWEVLDLLKTAGRQTAGYLAHEAATEALLETRKFDAFNRMSAFVVHDLKNLVAQLQLLLSNAERHHANPRFQRDMLATVGHVVTRINALLQQLRSGETPVDRPHGVDLRNVLARVQTVRAAGRGQLHCECDGEPWAIGHADRLERVIGHLVQNAFEAAAADDSRQPRVTVGAARRGDAVVLEVADNGTGMTPEFIRDRLFKPFNTTKPGGMGIGTYESQQYIQSIGGRIEVDSTPDAGTRFRVLLRAAEPAAVTV